MAQNGRHVGHIGLPIGWRREHEPLRDKLIDRRRAERTERLTVEQLVFDRAPIRRLSQPRQALTSTRVSRAQVTVIDSNPMPE
jgi:hypothetical protein